MRLCTADVSSADMAFGHTHHLGFICSTDCEMRSTQNLINFFWQGERAKDGSAADTLWINDGSLALFFLTEH